jgi:hypothetical protein
MKPQIACTIALACMFTSVSSCSTENILKANDGSAAGSSGRGGTAAGSGMDGSGGATLGTGGTTGAGGSVTGGDAGDVCSCGSFLPGPCTPGEPLRIDRPCSGSGPVGRQCSCDGTHFMACNLGGLLPQCCERPGEVTRCSDGTWAGCLCNRELAGCGQIDGGIIVCDGGRAD